MEEPNRIIRTNELIQLLGISRSTIWRLENAGQFPNKRKVSPGAVGYLSTEIDEWIRTREITQANLAPTSNKQQS